VSESVPQLLTLVAVAKALCVSPHTVRSWVKKGKLRPTRICRRLLFDPAEILRFLAENSSDHIRDANSRPVAEAGRLA
jgi:predicted site-specific integrase-resolvase